VNFGRRSPWLRLRLVLAAARDVNSGTPRLYAARVNNSGAVAPTALYGFSHNTLIPDKKVIS
jgi:hypothetical protein